MLYFNYLYMYMHKIASEKLISSCEFLSLEEDIDRVQLTSLL